MSKNTPSAGKGWKDKGHSKAYLDGYAGIDWSKKLRTDEDDKNRQLRQTGDSGGDNGNVPDTAAGKDRGPCGN